MKPLMHAAALGLTILMAFPGCNSDSVSDDRGEENVSDSANSDEKTPKPRDDIDGQPDEIEPVLAAGGATWTSSDEAIEEQTVDARLHIWPASSTRILGSSNRIRRLFYWRVRDGSEPPGQGESIHARVSVVDEQGLLLGSDDCKVALPVGATEGTFEVEAKSGNWKAEEATHAVISLNDLKISDQPVGLSNFVKVKISH